MDRTHRWFSRSQSTLQFHSTILIHSATALQCARLKLRVCSRNPEYRIGKRCGNTWDKKEAMGMSGREKNDKKYREIGVRGSSQQLLLISTLSNFPVLL